MKEPQTTTEKKKKSHLDGMWNFCCEHPIATVFMVALMPPVILVLIAFLAAEMLDEG